MYIIERSGKKLLAINCASVVCCAPKTEFIFRHREASAFERIIGFSNGLVFIWDMLSALLSSSNVARSCCTSQRNLCGSRIICCSLRSDL